MSLRRLLPLAGMLFVSGCLWPVQHQADQAVWDVVSRPTDVAPLLPPHPSSPKDEKPPLPPLDKGKETLIVRPWDVQTTALMQDEKGQAKKERTKIIPLDLKIPPRIPGSEAPRIGKLPEDEKAKQELVRKLYPPLPPLQEVPGAEPGPEGKPYTLADLQKLAAINSPTLRQAASDVEAATGNMIQASMYPNPTVGFEQQPSNDNSTAGAPGVFIDQLIKTAGKLKLATAAAQKDLDNARLALRRARTDLATAVRSNYYTLIVSHEAMLVNRDLARFTDMVYRIQAELLLAGFAATYEPAGLRAQAFSARLAYKQAITTYLYNWKQLVAILGVRQMPLSEVAGRVDRLIPYFDYDKVLSHVLHNHTDVLTARNAVEKAKYNMKLAQVTPIPDVDFRIDVVKEAVLAPFQWYSTVSVGMAIPIWDQNKGAIIAAQAALMRASEESHRVEMVLTNALGNNYTNYKNNLDALEYYRRYILPDQVRYYRGVFSRRAIDINASFGDLVSAQQTLAANVGTYLTILNSLWAASVAVADVLQTEDLFALASPQALPELPDLSDLPPWPCRHVSPADHAQPGSACAAQPNMPLLKGPINLP